MYVLVAKDENGRTVGSLKLRPQPQTIGRAATCALILPSTGVSRTHASAYLHQRGGVVIEDAGSANGVLVDGQVIDGPTLIDHTNNVQLSTFVLSVELESKLAEENLAVGQMAAAPDTAEEWDTRLEARDGAASALASSTLELVGRGGPYDGTRFALEKPLMTVGRVDSNDVVLEDPSVSRRHAQLRLSVMGDRLTVLDLRSHNGTYVAGERVKRAEVDVGAVVRFGDLAFKLQRDRKDDASKGRKRMSPRSRLLIALASLVVIVGAVVGIAYMRRPPPKKKRVMTPEDRLRKLQAQTQKLIDEAKARLEQRQWSMAVVFIDNALKKDPLNPECKKIRSLALSESSHAKTYKKGVEFFRLGNRENLLKAKAIFLTIPQKSVYYNDIRYKVKEVNERVADGYRVEGVSRCRARYYLKCHEALCKFFELIPTDKPVAGEANLRRMLKRVERRMRRRRGFVTCKAPRFLSPKRFGSGGQSRDELLSKRYKDRRVRQVVELYVDGKIDVAIKQLARLRSKRYMRPHLRVLSDIDRRLLVIRGKYQEGYGAYRQRKIKDAHAAWALLLSQDTGLLPKNVESFYRREVLRALGNLYYDLGDEQFKLGRYRVAYRLWKRGKEVNAKHDRLLNGLLQLEKVAERLVRQGRRLAQQGRISDARQKLTTARDICAAGRPIRGEAKKALGRLGG